MNIFDPDLLITIVDFNDVLLNLLFFILIIKPVLILIRLDYRKIKFIKLPIYSLDALYLFSNLFYILSLHINDLFSTFEIQGWLFKFSAIGFYIYFNYRAFNQKFKFIYLLLALISLGFIYFYQAFFN